MKSLSPWQRRVKNDITLHNGTPLFLSDELNPGRNTLVEFENLQADADYPPGLLQLDEGIRGKIEGLAITLVWWSMRAGKEIIHDHRRLHAHGDVDDLLKDVRLINGQMQIEADRAGWRSARRKMRPGWVSQE